MPEVKLKFDGTEIALPAGVTTIGRTTDNAVAFPGDANVSRHHAEIEVRGGEFCLIDLGSSNGTTVNGEKITGEKYLVPGDVIVLGGSSRIEFGNSANGADREKKDAEAAEVPTGSPAHAALEDSSANEAAAGGGSSKLILMIAGGVVCLALLFVIIAAVVILFAGSSKAGNKTGAGGGPFSSLFGSSCNAKASITKPETGDTISAPTE